MSTQHSALSTQQELNGKLKRVREILAEFGKIVVAFSGGVDSTLLLKVARDVLGKPNVLAVTANSPSLAQHDLAEACRVAALLDVEHLVIETAEVEDPAYQANAPSRCYICKQELFAHLARIAFERDIPMILYGAIGDDLRDERPGSLAASEYGVRAPLAEAGFSKVEVREAARMLGLPNWDRPQNACLSSRIPHGREVTEKKLRMIERAEALLKGLGFQMVRVRHLGEHARIEVGPGEVGRFGDPGLCRQVAREFVRFGFRSVGVDRAGYHSGGADHAPTDELPLVVEAV